MKKGAKTKRSKKQVIEAIKGSRGIKTTIARRLGVDRHTVDAYLKRWPKAMRAFDNERETLLDQAEAKLYHMAIKEGREKSLHFLLSTIGRHRGYNQRQELELSGHLAHLTADQQAKLDREAQAAAEKELEAYRNGNFEEVEVAWGEDDEEGSA